MENNLQKHVKEAVLEDQTKLLNQLLQDVEKESKIDGSTDKKTREELLSFYKDKLDQSILDVLERKPDFYNSYNEIKKYMESNLFTSERKIDFQRKINSIKTNTKENIKKVIDQYNEFSNKQRLILHIFMMMFLVSIGLIKYGQYLESPQRKEKQEIQLAEKQKEEKEAIIEEIQSMNAKNYYEITKQETIEKIDILDKFLRDNNDKKEFKTNGREFILVRTKFKKTTVYAFTEIRIDENFGGKYQLDYQIHLRKLGDKTFVNIDQTMHNTTVTYIKDEAYPFIDKILDFTSKLRNGYIETAQETIENPSQKIQDLEQTFPEAKSIESGTN